MNQNLNDWKWIKTLGRVVLFCISSAIALAISSALTKGLSTSWSSILSIVTAAIIALILTIVFVRWEGLQIKDVGLVPGRYSIFRLLIGFVIGSFLATMQVVLVMITSPLTLVRFPEINIVSISLNLLLYLSVACREEVSFRGYPLRSLNYVIGPWGAQLIIVFIFSIEHVVGGMTWPQALLGSGVGALLFGLAALKTKGLALPIGLHSAWNFVQWLLGFKNGNGMYKVVVEKSNESRVDQIGWISYLLVMGLAILAFYYWKKGPKSTSNFFQEQPIG
jgi:uncharacterized protein